MTEEYVPLHGTVIEKNNIPLDELAGRIRELLIRIQERSGDDIWEAGELLRIARLDIPSDEHYGNWVSANFSDTPVRTLYNYCQLSTHFYERQELAKLIPSSGLYLLAAPKCDDFREEVIKEIEAEGEPVSYGYVQKVIKVHKPPRTQKARSQSAVEAPDLETDQDAEIALSTETTAPAPAPKGEIPMNGIHLHINNDYTLANAHTELDRVFTLAPSFDIEITTDKQRSLAQNKLIFKLYRDATQTEKGKSYTPQEMRCLCKLTLGIPILYTENDKFREKYKKGVKDIFNHEQKLALMDWFPVSSIMSPEQCSRYIDAIAFEFQLDLER